jgi:hypothetical protein
MLTPKRGFSEAEHLLQVQAESQQQHLLQQQQDKD